MSIRRKPHTASVLDASSLYDGANAVIGTERQEAVTVRGQLTPMSVSSTLEKWGLEIMRPHLWLCDLSDEGKFKEGDYLEISASRYLVRGIKRWGALPNLDHLECLLEQI